MRQIPSPCRDRSREIAVKSNKFVCYPDEGVCRRDTTGPERTQASLTDDQALDLARLAFRLEEHYGTPQDIEWAIDRSGDNRPAAVPPPAYHRRYARAVYR